MSEATSTFADPREVTIPSGGGTYVSPQVAVAAVDGFEGVMGGAFEAGYTHGTWFRLQPFDSGSIDVTLAGSLTAPTPTTAPPKFILYSAPYGGNPSVLNREFDYTPFGTVGVLDDVLYYIQVITSDAAGTILLTIAFSGAAGGAGPTITVEPQDAVVTEHTSVSFHSAASGLPAPTCQWQKRAG